MERSDDSKILQRLEKWAQRKGSLPPVIETYEKLLRLQSEARSRLIVQQPDLTKEAALSQLSQGIPLLKFEELPLDWPTVQNLFRAVALVLTNTTAITAEISKPWETSPLTPRYSNNRPGIGIKGTHCHLSLHKITSARSFCPILFRLPSVLS